LLSRKLKIKILLYGCEAWSLILREERKLKVFENMVLRRIFGPRRDKVTGEVYIYINIICKIKVAM